MSDSDTANIPPDAIISRTLKDVVIGLHKSGNDEDITVKRVRTRAEEQLGLPSGFLKTNHDWKQKSSELIHEAVDKYCGDEPEPPEPSPAKPTPKPKPTKTKATETGRGQKRKAAPPAKKPQKRAKVVESSEELSEEAAASPPPEADTASEPESEAPKKKKIVRRPKQVVDESEEEEKGDTEKARPATPTLKKAEEGNGSDSDLSSLIDETPVKKKRQKKSPTEKRTKATKPKAPARSKAKAAEDEDPDQAEIKRLQGWLVKCGIRKVWGKELAKFDTPREKIKHLKEMLKEAGMEGKYSVEKAAKIKEQRELAKDLEAIQEVAQRWGSNEDSGRPRRRAAAAAPKVVLPDIGDEDEEDSGNEKESGDEDDESSEAHVSGDNSGNNKSESSAGGDEDDSE